MSASGASRPDFERFARAHARAAGCQRTVALAVAATGLLVLVVGLTPLASPLGQHGWALMLAGLLIAACAAFPAREYYEHRDRIAGLEVLEEEWSALEAAGGVGEAERARMCQVVAQLYSKQVAG